MQTPDVRWEEYADVDAADHPQRLAAHMDALAELDAFAAAKHRSIERLELCEPMTVCDVGSGTGVDLPALAALVGVSGTVIGVDASATMCALAERRTAAIPQVRVIRTEGAELPLETGSVDAVRAERTLQHVLKPEAIIAEVRRVLRPGGRFTIVEGTVSGDGIVGPQRRGWVGRFLPLLLARAGYGEVEAEVLSMVVTDSRDLRLLGCGLIPTTVTEATAHNVVWSARVPVKD